MLISLAQFIGLFNILVGLMLTISLLLFVAGAGMWATRLGTAFTYRDDALRVIQWAISVLFALVLMLILARFIQEHTDRAVFILGLAVLALIAWAVVFVVRESAKPDEEH